MLFCLHRVRWQSLGIKSLPALASKVEPEVDAGQSVASIADSIQTSRSHQH